MARKSSKPRSRRGKAPTYAQLKKRLDGVCSEYVRRKDADSAGFVQCITCGTSIHWTRAQCSHYISPFHLETRYDSRNVAAACYACNVLRNGNLPNYTLWLTKKYGPWVIQELVDKSHKT